MPTVLKLCTASSVAFPLFIASTMLPDSSVKVFDQLVPTTAWWALGGGPSIVVVGSVMCAASWLMLKRAARARLVYAAGWALLLISILFIGARFDLSREDLEISLASNTLTMVALVAYLYLSRSVRRYFEDEMVRKKD